MLVVSVLMVAAGPAHAERATLGTAVPVPSSSGFVCSSPCTLAQTALPDASSVTPPGEGRIDAWWALGKGSTLHVKLRILHTVANGQFTAVGTSSDQTPTETLTNFPADIAVQPGDLLGATMSGDGHSDILESASTMGANINVFSGPFPDGSTQSFTNQFPDRLEFGAEFVYRPVVTGVAAASGSTAGGDSIVITGNHLTDTTSVRFGTTEAPSFTIDSNTEITAVSPPDTAGQIDVTARGPGGASATGSADRFTYVVPQGVVSPATVDFGRVAVGGASGTRAVTLTNTGTVPIAIGSVALVGDDSAQFTKFSDDCSGRRVAPGSSCSVPMIFTPSAAGVRRTTLRFDDDLPGSPQNVVLVGGGPPSNAFTIGHVRRGRLRVKVASDGTVLVRGTRRKRRLLGTSSATGGPGTISVGLHLTSRARKILTKKHRLKVGARVSFRPNGGTAASKTVTRVVKKNARRA
jgi:hypothetical protein